jgi:L-threonylcarbamoyladenylate synthase
VRPGRAKENAQDSGAAGGNALRDHSHFPLGAFADPPARASHSPGFSHAAADRFIATHQHFRTAAGHRHVCSAAADCNQQSTTAAYGYNHPLTLSQNGFATYGMKTELLSADHPSAIAHTLDVLNHGGLVVFPTDTVYGLAALPFQSQSIERLYVVKGRSSQKAIAILLGKLSHLDQVAANLNPMAVRLAEHFWPGPLTLVVPRNPALPAELTPDNTIGVRMPDHPVALELLRQSGPLAVTSANLSGRENTVTAQEVINQLRGRIHLILDGGHIAGGIPSTVVNCMGAEPVILRKGPITLAAIQAVLLTES